MTLTDKHDTLKVFQVLVIQSSLGLALAKLKILRETVIPLYNLVVQKVQIVVFYFGSFLTMAVESLPGFPG